jgi:hypothetical protein
MHAPSHYQGFKESYIWRNDCPINSIGPPGSAPPKSLFWSARLLEWSIVVTLHCWLLSTGKGRRLPIHPSVKEQTVGPVTAWTSKLSKQAWQTLLLRLHILQMPSEGASRRGSGLSACHGTHQSLHHTRTGCLGSSQAARERILSHCVWL